MDIYQTSINPLQTQDNEILPPEGHSTSKFVGLKQGEKYKLYQSREGINKKEGFASNGQEPFANLDPFRQPGLSMTPILEDSQLFRQQKLYQYIAWTLLAVTIILLIFRFSR
jgi:hypothetical protein